MRPRPHIGLIRNPLSTRNRRRGTAEVTPGVTLYEATSREALMGALAELRAAGASLLIIDGGDGTVREVLTWLPSCWGESRPRLAILAHGNTNLIARKAGSVRGEEGLVRLLAAEREARLVERRLPVLTVEREGAGTLRGFMMGWGAYATGTRLAAQEIAARGGGQVALAICATLRRALTGGEAMAIRRGIEAAVAVDGRAQPEGRRLVGLATTLPGTLVLGLRPFWGGGAGPLRWTDVAAPGYRLAFAAPFSLAGRPTKWMRRHGYRSGRGCRLDLATTSPFVLDGEVFEPGPAGRVRITAAETATFVTPA